MKDTFEEAFLMSAKSYFKGEGWEKTDKIGKRKYDKKYFDAVSKDMTNPKEIKNKELEEVEEK